jgi:hypothetical protein
MFLADDRVVRFFVVIARFASSQVLFFWCLKVADSVLLFLYIAAWL